MKKTLSILLTLFAWVSVNAQYYGNTVYVEGFDDNEQLGSWEQVCTKEKAGKWVCDEPWDSFSLIDNTSKASAVLRLKEGGNKITLTSPEIDLADRSNLQVGFYGKDLYYSFRNGGSFFFRISKDGGNTWTDLFKDGDEFFTEEISYWNIYKYQLPKEFENKKVMLQFLVDIPADVTPSGMDACVDGVFISESPKAEVALMSVNYSTDERQPSYGAYYTEEPVTLTFKNNGIDPLTSIELYYQLDNNSEVAETYVPESPVASGETAEYTFNQKMNLKKSKAKFVLKAGIRLEGDYLPGNNSTTAYIQNTATDLPYSPEFVYEEDGQLQIGTDEWTMKYGNEEAYWDYNRIKNTFYWFIEGNGAMKPYEASLISRPMYLEKGKYYSVSFNAYSVETGKLKNKMKVMVYQDAKNIIGHKEVWKNEDITEDNARNTTARFSIEKDGIYYVEFKCYSDANAPQLRFENISFDEVAPSDVKLIEIVSPASEKFEYTSDEKVSVLVKNMGQDVIGSGALKVNMRLDNNDVITETVPVEIKSNETYEYTFNKKIDASDVTTSHRLTVWTSLEGDTKAYNDSVSTQLVSEVTGTPYIADFGTSSSKSEEVYFWSVKDSNEDGYAFYTSYDSEIGTYVFAYGGGYISWNYISIPTSNDQLYSRPLRLEEGSEYKLMFGAKVGQDKVAMPLAVRLYEMNGNDKTLVSTLYNGAVTSSVYQEINLNFNVKKTANYIIEYDVVKSDPLDFKIYLGMFRVFKLYENDLSIESIEMPTTNISKYNTFPVGVLLKNEGKNIVSEFTLNAKSASIGEVNRSFENVRLLPNSTYLIYFNDDFTFNGNDSEDLTITVSSEKDENALNNDKTVTLNYIENMEIPFSQNYSEPLDTWASINNNRDSYRFIPVKDYSIQFQYVGDNKTEADDILVTPTINMEKGKTFVIENKFDIMPGDTAAFDVYAYNTESKERTDIVKLRSIVKKGNYTGYFSVPESGSYNICFAPVGKVPSLAIFCNLSIKDAEARPDIKMVDIKSPSKDAVYTANETVVATFVNNGSAKLSTIPFTCKVGDKVYENVYPSFVGAGKDVYTIEFKDINLSVPADYTISITANVNSDLTPEDNTVSATFKSLPIVDCAVVSLDSPKSGALSKNEKITVTVKNTGKGVINNIPVKCVITATDFEKTLDGIIEEPLNDGESLQYTFPETVDMYNTDTYKFEISVSKDGDVNASNNKIEVMINSTDKEFDAGVVGILSPTENILTDSETVKISVKNYSTVDLYDVPVFAEIQYEGAPDIVKLSGVVPAIKAGETAEYAFNETVSMMKQGEYTIHCYTAVENDANAENDAFTGIVKCLKQDVGVTEIINPTTGEELGLQNVTIVVKNFGEAAISNIPVSYKIGRMPQLGLIEETILPGDTAVYTFQTQYEFVQHKKFTIVAMTEMENDADPDNDSCSKEIENIVSGIEDSYSNSFRIEYDRTFGEMTVCAEDNVIDRVCVINTNGVRVKNYDGIDSQTFRTALNIPNGIYLVKVYTTDGRTFDKKLVLNK